MKNEQPAAEPIVLRENCIINGKFYAAGEPLPYDREEDLPAALKPLIAGPGAPAPFQPSERDIYNNLPRSLRRQARMLEHAVAYEDQEIAQMNKPLPPETAAAIEDAHTRSIALQKAQAEYNGKLLDAAYEQAAAAAQPPPLYVRRGGEWGRVARAKLKPGEHVFALRPNGEYETIGVVDSRGEPPPPEVII
jgi:hypothetical protein